MAIQLAASVAEAEFAWLVGSVCQINRLPFDPALLLQRYPAPHSLRQLIEALNSFGFRTGEGDIAKAAFPCIGFVAGDKPQPAILVKRDAERLLYFVAGSQTPQTAPAASLKEMFEPRVILVQRETAAEPAAGDGAPVERKFGFGWFWAEFAKHKRIWRDVLAASLFIQLIGLTTPLGTQVVIDKVVVHQTESTLIAIAVGLGMFLLFNAAMGWLRQAACLQGAGGTGRAGTGGGSQPLSACTGHAGLERNPPRYALDPGVRPQPRAEGLARSRPRTIKIGTDPIFRMSKNRVCPYFSGTNLNLFTPPASILFLAVTIGM